MLIYILYFIFLAILAIQYQFTPFKSDILLSIIVIVLAFLAGFQDISVSKDYQNYQNVFDDIYQITGDGYYYLLAFEPGFVAIVVFFRKLFATNYGMAIMIFYGLTSLTLKVFTINRLSINPYLTILFYYSYLFMILEMTQIRIGLASSIFLISLFSFLNGKRGTFLGLILLATCFHYSAIFYLLILIFNIDKLNKNLYVGILILSIILGAIKLPVLNLLGSLDFSSVSTKLTTYIEISKNGSIAVNVFNSLNILNILCCFYLLVFVKNDEIIKDKRLILFLKCNILSIFSLSILAGAPAFAMRFNQLFGIVQIFLFGYLLKYLPAKKFNVFLLVVVAGIFFYVMEIYGELLNPFKIITIK
jgi:hypothetical protein